MTGGRILGLKEHIGNEKFICTYGDGLADIDIEKLIAFHNSHNGIATVTAAKPPSRFGILDIGENNQVVKFTEKPLSLGFVNAGFFCFEPEVFNYLAPDSILEREPLEKISSNGELFAYKHHGFWKPMDTIRDTKDLIEIWNSDNPPWKNW
jgi:glucose-1-phosphate cytidylyltransferase